MPGLVCFGAFWGMPDNRFKDSHVGNKNTSFHLGKLHLNPVRTIAKALPKLRLHTGPSLCQGKHGASNHGKLYGNGTLPSQSMGTKMFGP